MGDTGESKIHIDSDWKSQARAEKERLAAKEKAKQAPQAPAAAAPGGGSADRAPATGTAAAGSAPGHDAADMDRLPEASFQTLLGTMISQTLMYMGAFPDPETGRAIVSLEHAQFHIDLLGVLHDKTRNNLTEQEKQDLEQSLNELRLRFVDIQRAVAEARLRRQSQAGMGGMPGGLAGGGVNMTDLNSRLRGS
jgi:hypothetical protein